MARLRNISGLSTLGNEIFQPETFRFYCLIHAALRNQTAVSHMGTGVPLVTHVALLSEELHYMVNLKKSALGAVTQSRTALAVVAATFLVGGGVTEASAKSKHYNRHHHHARAATEGAAGGSWRDANASIAP